MLRSDRLWNNRKKKFLGVRVPTSIYSESVPMIDVEDDVGSALALPGPPTGGPLRYHAEASTSHTPGRSDA